MENICRFVSSFETTDTVNTLHFVYENHPVSNEKFVIQAAFMLYLVAAGEGRCVTPAGACALAPGDIFFTLAARPFRIEHGGDLRYLYISFVGLRAQKLLDRLGVGPERFHFPGFSYLLPLWEEAVAAEDRACDDLRSEGVLLYTLSCLGARRAAEEPPRSEGLAARMKKYLDDHYADSSLGAAALGTEFQYNPKYCAAVFKKHMGMGVNGYLRMIRIQHACNYMKGGITQVADVARLCGFEDPLYFSRVFRRATGAPPSTYIKEENRPRGREGPERKGTDAGRTRLHEEK